jgi:hypothetical protein
MSRRVKGQKYVLCPKCRRKMAEIAKARWSDTAHKERMIKIMNSPRTKKRMGMSIRKMHRENPRIRQKMSRSMHRFYQDPEKHTWNKDKHWSEEVKAKIRKGVQNYYLQLQQQQKKKLKLR